METQNPLWERTFKEAGISKKTATGYTWHHVDDFNPKTGTTTMQLVKTSAHEAIFPHGGSVAQYEKHFKVKYESRESVLAAAKKDGSPTRFPNAPPNLGTVHDRRSIMIENTFSNDDTAITPADLDHLESVIGKKHPPTSSC
ncbi:MULTISPECIES: HNH endonuclease signature motif containing protein [Pseudomonas]|uniref:HNH endonuclease signature motif containing protein n=1 Tax=Pseudomonas TaxID=286 RepID=UPI001E3D9773|nr:MULTISPECIES: HNH endonuclease [Pseudomonas]MCD4530005.1 HNH endonuclease [Pseudomonas sp. C3-2018]